MRHRETIEIEDVECIHETAMAILVTFAGVGFWIPNSQVHDDSEVFGKGDSGCLVVNKWFAEKKGLIDYL